MLFHLYFIPIGFTRRHFHIPNLKEKIRTGILDGMYR